MKSTFLAAGVLLLLAQPALADRPVTEMERASILAAIAPFGCTATKMEFDSDDNRFEVDDADCGDRRDFDLELNTAFEIVGGERPVTNEEQARIDAALARAGCSGGIAEFDYDDARFEIDKAQCGGQLFEIDLNRDFQIVKKNLDD
ncbi:hypothetical protein ABVT35_12185 [Hoeflea sp. TYP-13]